MKRTLLSLLSISLFTSASFAQSTFAPEIGLNLANVRFVTSLPTSSTHIKPGISAGGNFDIRLANQLYLVPGIFYRMNGSITKSDHTTTLYINTLELPVDLWYRFGAPGSNVFCLGGGGFAGLNISSKASWSAYTDGNGYPIPAGTQTLKLGNKTTDDLKKVDAGLGINAAYMLKSGLYFRYRYQLGLVNLNPETSVDLGIKSNVMTISIGYYIKDSKKKPGTPAAAEKKKEKKPKKAKGAGWED